MKRMKTRILLGCMVVMISLASASLALAQRCDEWVARVVSVEGVVQVRGADEADWKNVRQDDTLCLQDILRVQGHSRAAVMLRNEAVLRLDQKTTLTFAPAEEPSGFLLKLLQGSAHFFSRTPRSLKVTTPFVNAAVGGTEFLIRVEAERAVVSVFEGEVSASNESGSLVLTSGETAVAQARKAPMPYMLVRPRDAVQWAIYYPPILGADEIDWGEAGNGWQTAVRKSLEAYRRRDLAGAFAALGEAPSVVDDPRFLTYRAALLLSVGRVDEANRDIERALALDPTYSRAFALRSVIAVAQNRKEEALELGRRAVELAPDSPAALIALSYAQQAQFDLNGALSTVRTATERNPRNALAWARLAELWLMLGYHDKSLDAAQRAADLDPELGRTQTVLGFAQLSRIKVREAKTAFEKAVKLDQGDPMPRLGFGLAKIRKGDLRGGAARNRNRRGARPKQRSRTELSRQGLLRGKAQQAGS